MNSLNIKLGFIAILGILITACSTAKLEARFEANPQCKDVVNPKTGAIMPCPGSDKVFYKSVGLEPVQSSQTNTSAGVVTSNETTSTPQTASPTSEASSKQIMPTIPSADCKPTLHKKTGGILPCPSPN
jgi:hypothetical protein